MNDPTNQSEDHQDGFWHMLWAIAGTIALIYGCIGTVAFLTQGGRHAMAIVWFATAAIGGISMISFVWRERHPPQ